MNWGEAGLLVLSLLLNVVLTAIILAAAALKLGRKTKAATLDDGVYAEGWSLPDRAASPRKPEGDR